MAPHCSQDEADALQPVLTSAYLTAPSPLLTLSCLIAPHTSLTLPHTATPKLFWCSSCEAALPGTHPMCPLRLTHICSSLRVPPVSLVSNILPRAGNITSYFAPTSTLAQLQALNTFLKCIHEREKCRDTHGSIGSFPNLDRAEMKSIEIRQGLVLWETTGEAEVRSKSTRAQICLVRGHHPEQP